MTDSERIKELQKFTGLNFSKLAEEIGLNTVQTLYDIKNGKHGISKEVAEKIQARYLNISMSWLLTGEGEMLNSSGEKGAAIGGDSEESATMVLLLPISAQGGSLTEFITSVKENECEKVISPIKSVDFAMTVSGDSMSPEYQNGSRIFIKRINERAFIEWGKVYVLDTCNGTVIKCVVPSEKEGYVKCLSINPDPKYAPFEVALADIYGMYRVILCLSIK